MVVLLLAVLAGCTAKLSKEVVFYVDGTEYSKVVYDSNAEFKKPEDPEKRGYRFSGWYLDESFSKALKLNKKTKGKIKAYARFDEIRAELFQNGVSIGTNFILDVEVAKPKKDNLTIGGWDIDEEYKKRYIDPEFLTELDYEGKLSKIGVYKGNEEEETCETDEWVTKADFLNKQIFEEGWWENIMSDSAEYEKIKMIANKINTYSDISYM